MMWGSYLCNGESLASVRVLDPFTKQLRQEIINLTLVSLDRSLPPAKSLDPSRACVSRFPELTATFLAGAPERHDPPVHEVALLDLLSKPLETAIFHGALEPAGGGSNSEGH